LKRRHRRRRRRRAMKVAAIESEIRREYLEFHRQTTHRAQIRRKSRLQRSNSLRCEFPVSLLNGSIYIECRRSSGKITSGTMTK